MAEKRVKIKDIVKNQLPGYVKENFPLVGEFISQYYASQEFEGAPADLIQNIDRYSKIDSVTNLSDFTVLSADISDIDTEISIDLLNLEKGTNGFPEKFGLISIDDEIILYETKTFNGFSNCYRGFSGIVSYKNTNVSIASTYKVQSSDQLVFKDSVASSHRSGAKIYNLSSLFLKEFLQKIKYQLTPGFENRSFVEKINESILIKQIKDFYRSKGTDRSFEILFKCLYGEEVKVIRPRDYLFRPSDSQYKITNDLVVERISGPIDEIENLTLVQNTFFDIPKSYATITSPLEEIRTPEGEVFYKIKIDSGYNRDILYDGAAYGKFSVHAKTHTVGKSSSGSSVLDVDSTVGFPNKGELYVVFEDGNPGVISYSSKNLTQFLGCENITTNISNNSIVGINTYATAITGSGEEIRVRINSILNDLDVPSDAYSYEIGDTARIKSLGFIANDAISNNWIFNISTSYEIQSSKIVDPGNQTYSLVLKNSHIFNLGDEVEIIESYGSVKNSKIVDIISDKIVYVTGQGYLQNNLYKIRKKISKANTSKFPESNLLSTDIQNIYKNEEKTLVASSSIPFYPNQSLDVGDRSITFSGSFIGDTFKITSLEDHGFYTGDSVYYIPEKAQTTYVDIDGNLVSNEIVSSSLFQEGIYFIKRIDPNNVKFAKSRSDILNGRYLTLDEVKVVSNNRIEVYDFYGKTLGSQKLLREISPAVEVIDPIETSPGFTGILVNGVEILNYKSTDRIIYGPLEEIEVVSNGFDYDIINPPQLSISDSTGSGANGYCAVSGSLKEIRILDPGFDYKENPVIKITGGNGIGAEAKVNTNLVDHIVTFNSEKNSGSVGVGSTISTITFPTNHKFNNGEQVIYRTYSYKSIVGLVTDSNYYVSVASSTKVKLHRTLNDSISGINTISLVDYGIGNHALESFNKKLIVSSINVSNSGSGYQNKKRTVSISGINTSIDLITIPKHDFKSGEIVKYSSESPLGGLSNGSSYYVTKIDDNSFKLSEVGTGSYSEDYYYRTKQFVNITSKPDVVHVFNYPDIKVELIGKASYEAQIQPIFRGEITSVHLSSGGSSYGVENIFNIDRQPLITVVSGSDADIFPIISNGKISQILIKNSGKNYTNPPDLIVDGTGSGAVLTPVISNGQIVDVKIISGGYGYSQNSTKITTISPGSGSQFRSKIKTWTVNLFKKYDNKITGDDGFLTLGKNPEFGLQYCHIYAPRKLREILYSRDQSGKILFSNSDLRIVNNTEIKSKDHSPIIGWSYDGYPIYGPYGYSKKNGGVVSQMKSGYKLSLDPNRPSLDEYPEGFFIEDYKYYFSDDETVLDEHNGRFCITPEFPNGIYAYFTTINDYTTESSGPFANYKKPTFPYLIGNSYKSKPNEFNYKKISNQDDIDLNETDWVRNTRPHNLTEDGATYEYISIPNKLNQTIDIVGVSPGSIDKVNILLGGEGYKINDNLVFNNIDKNGNPRGNSVSAVVSTISGKSISSISAASTSLYNVELYPFDGNFIAYNSSPHNFNDYNLISISGLSTSTSLVAGNYIAGVRINELSLAGAGTTTIGIKDVSVTGIVTYISVKGNLDYPNIRENDIYSLGDEKIKILSIDRKSSRLRILRGVDGTVATSHTVTSILYEIPRKLTIQSKIKEDYLYPSVNKQIYFNPKESVAIGTNSSVGIGTTLYFSNPGAGVTQIFVPNRSIYLPNHGLNTGDLLTYQTNGGTSISVFSSGVGTTTLSNNSTVYVAKINEDLIGISTVKVGLGSTGFFTGISTNTKNIGLLFFTGIGTGTYHSFQTNYSSLTGKISRNTVTVSTAETHGLSNGDLVSIDIQPAIATTFIVKYNDYNRMILLNPKSFSSVDVNIIYNSITIQDHGLISGQKVIYTSQSPVGGLTNNGIYYVVLVDENTIQLSNSYYNSTKTRPEIIDLTSSSYGTLSLVNPPLKLYRNSIVIFDLSDSSLSYPFQSIRYSAFRFEIYKDSKFENVFDTTKTTKTFNVQRSGTIGITTDAKLTLIVDEYLPQILYYNLVPIISDFIPAEKKEIISDFTVDSYNQLESVYSDYNGIYRVEVTTENTFRYFLPYKPEKTLYQSPSILNYKTNSLTAHGSISDIKITNKGNDYYSLPGISSVISSSGSGSILEASSSSVGKIKKTKILDVGFNFPSDKTLRPIVSLPKNIKINNLSSFEYIGIISQGRGYVSAPKLLVFDGRTKQLVKDVDLYYKLGDRNVTIKNNTYSLSDTNVIIVPTQNSNGIGITNIFYNPSTKKVTAWLSDPYTVDTFPIKVNDRIFIENVNVGTNTTGKGYNSKDYDYSLFTVTEVDPNPGGNGNVSYSLDGYLSESEFPGNQNIINSSSAVIIPERFLPSFSPVLRKNNYFVGETVKSGNSIGVVENWDPIINYLKISTNDDFRIGEIVEGLTSKTQGIASSITQFDCYAKLDSTSKVINGWQNNAGFLNDDLQKIQDSLYYQNFSYSIKSKIDYDTWNDAVSSLNHTVGFRKYSDLQLESKISKDFSASLVVGLSTQNSNLDLSVDITSYGDINCFSDFDFCRENYLQSYSSPMSDKIYFNNVILTDYYESIGNRVLSMDDISGKFNSGERPSKYSDIDTFDIYSIRSQKYFMYIRDKKFTGQRQAMLTTLIHNDSYGVLSQYGRVETVYDLGSLDFIIDQPYGILRFYPTKYAINNYDISLLSCGLNSDDILVGTGTTMIGSGVKIESNSTALYSGNSSVNIVSIATTYTSAKIIVQISRDYLNYQLDELNVVHDGTNVHFLEWGQLNTNSRSSFSSSGYGTYYPYISGSTLKIDFIPNVSIGNTFYIKTLNVSIANTSTTGIGTLDLGHALLTANTVSIASSSSPTANPILNFYGDYDAAYCLIQVSDITNNRHQFSEVIAICDDVNSDLYVTEFANLQTQSGLGTIGGTIVGLGSTSQLTFTPLPNIQTQVKVYANVLKIESDVYGNVSLNNSEIRTNYGIYYGTDTDKTRSFELTHNQYPIFERYFSSNSSVIDTTNDIIEIPSHFFVTGEEVVYNYSELNPANKPIGIATTTISGIGLTDKLPQKVYIVKYNDNKVRVAASASDALKSIPKTLDLTSIGIGTHKFTAKNQNSRVIISLDNIIQSPVVETQETANLDQTVGISDEIITVDNTSPFYGGDLIKVDDEIMKIQTIYPNNQIGVRRSWLGTDLIGHSIGAKVTKIFGSYNIVNNTLNFTEAPYGKVPQSYPSSPSDEKDWVGISTGSHFHGRCFLRSGEKDSSNEPYYKNYIFNSISNFFNGVDRTFTLKSKGSNITGISNEGSIILINDVFQAKGDLYEQDNINYILSESAGITSITFTGTASSVSYDINSSNLPIGGVIVSVGSTEGFGYQPLISAGATAVVSTAGTIKSISIGNSGSGYRASSKYEILSNTSSNVSAGTTTIYIQNKNSVFSLLNLLNTGSNCTIGVGTFITPTNIISVGSTSVKISTASTIPYQIPTGTPINININNPQIGIVRVGVSSTSKEDSEINNIGFATIKNGRISSPVFITNVAYGYTFTSPPKVVFDAPLSYSDIPLIYSSYSSSGIGTAATIDIVVGQGSSVIDFEIKNTGYGYKNDEILTLPIGGLVGIPTTSSFNASKEFQVSIQNVFSDKFTGWALGELQSLDDISDLFDGEKTTFPLTYFGDLVSIRVSKGSNINPQDLLLVFVNDILQVPGQGYTFNGGSLITFTEAPKGNSLGIPGTKDTCKILFYKGTGSIDVVERNILETVKVGDELTLSYDSSIGQSSGLLEDARTVTSILASDLVSTNPYFGPGNSTDESLSRPVIWCKQTQDKIIGGKEIAKDRMLYEPNINPSAYLISSVGIGSTFIFVDNLTPFFNPVNESKYPNLQFQNQVTFVSQNTKISAAATAVVSASGTISSIIISNGGFGYLVSPNITIQNPIGIDEQYGANAICSISSGIVSSISVTNPGTGYTQSNPPLVLIDPPSVITETNKVLKYEGDCGIICGISKTSVGVASTGIVFDFAIESDSFLRNSLVSGITTISGIQTGYYFVVYNSNVGNGVTSIDEQGQIVGIGTTCLDNIYKVARVSIAQTGVPGLGVTYVARVTVSVSNYNNLTGLGSSSFFGNFSWGRINLSSRSKETTHSAYTRSGYVGISTGTIVTRTKSLKYYNYKI